MSTQPVETSSKTVTNVFAEAVREEAKKAKRETIKVNIFFIV